MIPLSQSLGAATALRRLRAWLYRRGFGVSRRAHQQRRKGFERRNGAEEMGRTQEDWMSFLSAHGVRPEAGAVMVELAAGDGLVGSLGSWLEDEGKGARCFLWEHRLIPFRDAVRLRPLARVMNGRLTNWERADLPGKPWMVSSSCSRQTSLLWKAIRRGSIRPPWLVIWNPTARSVWWRRARRAGYRLRWVHANREYYQGP